ncbi:MAG TPA: hypothetical protein VGO65_10815 [Pseudolysinimonas sp.]|jgi:hypothetical protein|nr:hypothetical protein [Pseudolysinimonas sp.]
MRNRWIIAQLAVAALLLAVSLLGIIGSTLFDAAELVFSFAGGIQAFAVFPGLVLSLVVNALLMGLGASAPVPSTAQKVLLVVEFVLIAALLLFHFYTDPAGNTLGLAVVTWPLLIALCVVLAVIALARRAGRVPATPAPPVPPVPEP